MTTNNHIDQDELALFAMQLLEKEESAEITTHVAHCQQCRHEVAEIHGDLAVLAMTTEMHSPPALARERLMTQVRREQRPRLAERAPQALSSYQSEPPMGRRGSFEGLEEQARRGHFPGSDLPQMGALHTGRRSAPDDPAPKRGTATRLLPWAGWAIAAGMAVAAGDLLHQRDVLRGQVATDTGQMARLSSDAAEARLVMETITDRSATRVTLTRSKQPPIPLGRASYLADRGSLVFLASNMAPLDPYRTYELWLIPSDGRDPIAAGIFRPDSEGNASVIMPHLPKGVPAKAFGITIEDEGGSQTPTMPIVMAGT